MSTAPFLGFDLVAEAQALKHLTINEALLEIDSYLADLDVVGAGHTHAIADVTGLQSALDGKAALSHSHAWGDITSGRPTTLAGYAITDAQPLDADLTAVAGLSAAGIIARTGAGTAAARTITGTVNQVVVANGDGVSGNPTLSLPQAIHSGASPAFAGLTVGASQLRAQRHIVASSSEETVSYFGKNRSNLANWTSYGKPAPTITYAGGSSYSTGLASDLTNPFSGANQAFAYNFVAGASVSLEYDHGTAFPVNARSIWVYAIEYRTTPYPTSVLVEGYDSSTSTWTTFINDSSPIFTGGVWVSADISVAFFSTFSKVRYTVTHSTGSGIARMSAVVMHHNNLALGYNSLPGLHRLNTFTVQQAFSTSAGSAIVVNSGAVTLNPLTASRMLALDGVKGVISPSAAEARGLLGLGAADSVVLGGLTVGSISGYVRASAGVLSGQSGVPWADITGAPSSFAPLAHTLDGHSNVTISSNSAGELLKWTGTAWVNNTLAEAGIAAAGHAHAVADVTGLQAALDGKALVSHMHGWAEITGRPTTLAGYGITGDDRYSRMPIAVNIALPYPAVGLDSALGWVIVPYSPHDGGATAATFDIERIEVKANAASTTYSCTVKLQKSSDQGATWSDVAGSSTVFASGASGRRSMGNTTVTGQISSGDLVSLHTSGGEDFTDLVISIVGRRTI